MTYPKPEPRIVIAGEDDLVEERALVVQERILDTLQRIVVSLERIADVIEEADTQRR